MAKMTSMQLSLVDSHVQHLYLRAKESAAKVSTLESRERLLSRKLRGALKRERSLKGRLKISDRAMAKLKNRIASRKQRNKLLKSQLEHVQSSFEEQVAQLTKAAELLQETHLAMGKALTRRRSERVRSKRATGSRDDEQDDGVVQDAIIRRLMINVRESLLRSQAVCASTGHHLAQLSEHKVELDANLVVETTLIKSPAIAVGTSGEHSIFPARSSVATRVASPSAASLKATLQSPRVSSTGAVGQAASKFRGQSFNLISGLDEELSADLLKNEEIQDSEFSWRTLSQLMNFEDSVAHLPCSPPHPPAPKGGALLQQSEEKNVPEKESVSANGDMPQSGNHVRHMLENSAARAHMFTTVSTSRVKAVRLLSSGTGRIGTVAKSVSSGVKDSAMWTPLQRTVHGVVKDRTTMGSKLLRKGATRAGLPKEESTSSKAEQAQSSSATRGRDLEPLSKFHQRFGVNLKKSVRDTVVNNESAMKAVNESLRMLASVEGVLTPKSRATPREVGPTTEGESVLHFGLRDYENQLELPKSLRLTTVGAFMAPKGVSLAEEIREEPPRHDNATVRLAGSSAPLEGDGMYGNVQRDRDTKKLGHAAQKPSRRLRENTKIQRMVQAKVQIARGGYDKFQVKVALKKVAAAKKVSPRTFKDTRALFGLWDRSNNGFLSYNDFSLGLKKVCSLNDDEVGTLLAHLDQNLAGKVEHREFNMLLGPDHCLPTAAQASEQAVPNGRTRWRKPRRFMSPIEKRVRRLRTILSRAREAGKDERAEHTKKKLHAIGRAIRAHGYFPGGCSLQRVFRKWDKDQSGYLEYRELEKVLRKDLRMPKSVLRDEDIILAIAEADTNADMRVCVDEFCSVLGQGGVLKGQTPRGRARKKQNRKLGPNRSKTKSSLEARRSPGVLEAKPKRAGTRVTWASDDRDVSSSGGEGGTHPFNKRHTDSEGEIGVHSFRERHNDYLPSLSPSSGAAPPHGQEGTPPSSAPSNRGSPSPTSRVKSVSEGRISDAESSEDSDDGATRVELTELSLRATGRRGSMARPDLQIDRTLLRCDSYIAL